MKPCNEECTPCCDFCAHVVHEFLDEKTRSGPIGCHLHNDYEHNFSAKACGACDDFCCRNYRDESGGKPGTWMSVTEGLPKVRGWYLTRVEFPIGDGKTQSYAMELFFHPDIKRWKNNALQLIFDTYEVLYASNPFGRERIYTEDLCDRIDSVTHWMPMPELPKINK